MFAHFQALSCLDTLDEVSSRMFTLQDAFYASWQLVAHSHMCFL